jgi:hypothetical protein
MIRTVTAVAVMLWFISLGPSAPTLADSTAGLLSGVEFLGLGLRRLRDLPTPVGVFQR